jgi:hypothetical protein
MEDLGQPTSYLVVDRGAPVYSSDGVKLGRVVQVLSAREADMFDGVVFDTSAGPGGHRFVDAPEVAALYERGIVLSLDAEQAAELPKPTANPGSIRIGPKDLGGGGGFADRMRDIFRGRR